MFCPKCGSEQVSDNIRFCSRCGIPLGGVTEFLALIENPVLHPVVYTTKPTLYRRITSQIGAKIVFASIVMIPVAFILAVIFDSPGPLAGPFLLFILGVAQLMYKLIFGDPHLTAFQPLSPQFNRPEARLGLTPGMGQTVPDFEFKGKTTTGLVQPPSVTEPTTNLLHNPTERNS